MQTVGCVLVSPVNKSICQSLNTGSVYLCAVGLLSLGLPATDEYWSAPYTEWTNLRAWKGESDVKADHALK